jgi:dihydroorotase
MKLLIKNTRIAEAAASPDEARDILIASGKIVKVGKNITANGSPVIDATGKIALPGIIDMHVHLREPGREDKETVASGTAAALKGGVTSVVPMSNTTPVIDSKKHIQLLKEIIKKSAKTNVFICGALTKGRYGKEPSDVAALAAAGAVALSDDGTSVDDDKLMERIMRRAKSYNILVMEHCEDVSLSQGGVVNFGFTSTRMGLRGVSSASEYTRVTRDLALAEKTKCRLHISHVSCKESVELIRKAKKKGVGVTAETAPHYIALNENSVLRYDTNMKMNPPLRSKEDQEALRRGLCDGTIDIIASDHAPHTENEKEIEFDRAAFGVIGLETILAVSIAELLETGLLDWPGIVRKLCTNPAQILGLTQKGRIAEGFDADITLLDPAKEFVVTKSSIVSKSKNSPFLGRRLKGVVEHTIVGGAIAYKA